MNNYQTMQLLRIADKHADRLNVDKWKMRDLIKLMMKAKTVEQKLEYMDFILGKLNQSIPCPEGDGGMDCTPFCPSCEGNQFVSKV